MVRRANDRLPGDVVSEKLPDGFRCSCRCLDQNVCFELGGVADYIVNCTSGLMTCVYYGMGLMCITNQNF